MEMVNPLAAFREGYDLSQGLFDARTRRQAGNALAGGDYRGGANALLGGGMLDDGMGLLQYDQKNRQMQAEQAAAEKKAAAEARLAQFATLGRGVDALKKGADWNTQVKPMLLQMNPELEGLVQTIDQGLLSGQVKFTPEGLDQFATMIGKEGEKARFQLVNQDGLGVGAFDPMTGKIDLQYRSPPKPLVLGEGQIAYEGEPSVPTGGGPATGATGAGALDEQGARQALASILPGVQVTSGTRTPERNAAVGGVPNSYHLSGGALDFAKPPGLTKQQLEAQLRARGLPVVELIDEGDHFHWAYGRPQGQPGGRRVVAQGAPKARGARPATAEELAAYGIAPGTPAQISADGKIDILNVPGSKPLAVGLQKDEDKDLEALYSADTINEQINGFVRQIDTGKLNFGPISNTLAGVKLAAGMAGESDRNYGSFKAGMERLRNDSLRLNAGVQTDGDAQRAWNELFSNINDEKFVRQRLKEIAALNAKAIQFKRAKIDQRRTRNGVEPMFGAAPAAPAPKPAPKPAAAPKKPAGGLAAGGRPLTPQEAAKLPKGTRFRGTDGVERTVR